MIHAWSDRLADLPRRTRPSWASCCPPAVPWVSPIPAYRASSEHCQWAVQDECGQSPDVSAGFLTPERPAAQPRFTGCISITSPLHRNSPTIADAAMKTLRLGRLEGPIPRTRPKNPRSRLRHQEHKVLSRGSRSDAFAAVCVPRSVMSGQADLSTRRPAPWRLRNCALGLSQQLSDVAGDGP